MTDLKLKVNEQTIYLCVHVLSCMSNDKLLNKQEAHGPHRSPEKTVQINKHIWLYHNDD